MAWETSTEPIDILETTHIENVRKIIFFLIISFFIVIYFTSVDNIYDTRAHKIYILAT